MATGEEVKKGLFIELRADGIEDVKRAFNAVSSSLKEIRDTGRTGLAKVKTAFNDVKSSAGRSFGVLKNVLSVTSRIALNAAKITFAAAIGAAATLLGTIQQIKQATIDAIEEEKRLTSSAAIFNLKGDKNNSPAKIMGAIEYAFTKYGAAEADEVKDIITPLIENIQAALKGDEGALENLGKMGLSLDDFADAEGRILSMTDILTNMQKRYAQNPPEEMLAGLVSVFGDSDSQKMAKFLQQGVNGFKANMDEYLKMRDLVAKDEEISKRIVEAMAREAVAYDNLATSIKRGFGGALASVTKQKTAFVESIRGDMEDYATIFGMSYERIMRKVFQEAGKVTDALKGVSGTLVDGPLQGFLDKIETVIYSVLEAARGLVEYLATGRTDNAFITKTAEALKELWSVLVIVKNSITGMYESFKENVLPVLDGVMNYLGAEKDWQKVGIIAGLILFSGTIINILKLGGGLIAFFFQLGGAVAKAAKPVAELLSHMKGVEKVSGSLSSMKGVLGKGGLIAGAAVAGGMTGAAVSNDAKLAEEFASFVKNIERALKEQGKTEGEIAAYMQVAIQRFKDENGTSRFMQIQNLLDKIPGLGGEGFLSESDMQRMIQETINKAEARGESGLVEAARNQALKELEDYTADAGRLTISGVEFTNGVAADIEAGLRNIKADIPVNITTEGLLQRLTGDIVTPLMSADGRTRYYGDRDDSAGMKKDNLKPINLYFNNELVTQVLVSPDNLEKIQRNEQLSRRASR